MDFPFPPAERPTVAIIGDERRFPVARIFCVGRNYAEHAREMGADPDREPPFFFAKTAWALAPCSRGGEGGWSVRVTYPLATSDLHHEVELVAALGPGPDGKGVSVFGFAVGIDFTRRDVQAEAKKLARPWTTGKSFTGAAPIGPILPVSAFGQPGDRAISLSVNGEERQRGTLSQMIWGVEEVLEHLAGYDALMPGDLVFTGTPAGVGAVAPGDVLTCIVESMEPITVTVDPRS
ncbi:MAG: fumarylacetoacetate hydrolase family protein [Rhodospirillales bacterium]|nr:fumarylacetoacetate hydrolase family protein [Rhodospirillales bacterium]MCW9001266.1 fumarylacetoacetate hydrolase family protein [Rhodospirillales bacterium]